MISSYESERIYKKNHLSNKNNIPGKIGFGDMYVYAQQHQQLLVLQLNLEENKTSISFIKKVEAL